MYMYSICKKNCARQKKIAYKNPPNFFQYNILISFQKFTTDMASILYIQCTVSLPLKQNPAHMYSTQWHPVGRFNQILPPLPLHPITSSMGDIALEAWYMTWELYIRTGGSQQDKASFGRYGFEDY